jgi:uncharacterized membrane protein
MTDFWYFLGRFHVLALHLPIGILLLAVFLEFLVRKPRFQAIEASMPIVWLTGAIAALVTVTLGYMHAAEGGFDGPGVNLHRWSGVLLAAFAFFVWAWRAESPGTYAKAWPIAAVGTTALLFATGHYGGNLTHGSTYLVQYAPGPLRALAGLSEESGPRPPVTHLAAADIYLDVVAPALERRCSSCHNDDKRRGRLTVTSYGKIMQGGESGPAIVPGDPAKSDLYRRITLPHDNIDFMPKDGKTPLDSQEIAAIEWWISIGAPKSGTLGELQAPEQLQTTIAGLLGLKSGGKTPTTAGLNPNQ